MVNAHAVVQAALGVAVLLAIIFGIVRLNVAIRMAADDRVQLGEILRIAQAVQGELGASGATTRRLEDAAIHAAKAAAEVAFDLQSSHERADAAAGGAPGEQADAASGSG